MPDDLTPGPASFEPQRRATEGLEWAPRPGEAVPLPAVLSEVPSPSGPPKSRWPIFLIGLVAGLAGGAMSAVAVVAVMDRDSGGSATVSTQSGLPISVSVQQTSAVSDAAARGRASVVRISSSRRTATTVEQDVGSGVVLDNEGHILTNAHVVLSTDNLKVTLADGTERSAILVGTDFPFTDVAVIQIGPGKLTPVEIGDSTALSLGETLVAIGNPLAEFDGSVSVGVVSGLNRRRTFDGVRQDDLIQTDAAINSGNSGGALLNLRGQFVGMPTAILRQGRGSQAVEGIAFALPASRLIPIARKIIAEAGQYPRPTLGLDHLDLTAEVVARSQRLSVEEGAIVTQVARSGPADSAGVVQGDIITRVGDQDVNRDNPLLNALMHFEPGQTVRVVLNRNGRIIEAEVRLAKRS